MHGPVKEEHGLNPGCLGERVVGAILKKQASSEI